jgi:hypothetical protein
MNGDAKLIESGLGRGHGFAAYPTQFRIFWRHTITLRGAAFVNQYRRMLKGNLAFILVPGQLSRYASHGAFRVHSTPVFVRFTGFQLDGLTTDNAGWAVEHQ